jgi:stage II sporulation protein D
MMQVKPRIARFLTLLFTLLLLAGLAPCGGKKRPPPLPPSTRIPTGPPPSEAPSPPPRVPETTSLPRVTGTSPIRLLLRENFKTVSVERSSLAPLLNARVEGKRVTLRKGKAESGEELGTGTGFRLVPAGKELLLLDGVPYRGVLELFVNPLGAPVVVNELDLEDYLRGTVPNELHPTRFPEAEALKAQAVAARTFARYHLGSFVKRGFDLYSDERSQVYTGVKAEHPGADHAILATRGIVAMQEKRPILAVYSSTCGGKTESYEAMFGRALPYLKGGASCSDQLSPFHSWEARCDGPKLEATLNQRGEFGRLRGLQATRKGVSGRSIEMRLSGSKGNLTLQRHQVRSVLGIRSNLIDDIKTVKDKSGNVSEIVFRGRGWGHGVGLCQFGAVAMARRGASYEKILKHYYHDIQLKRNTE